MKGFVDRLGSVVVLVVAAGALPACGGSSAHSTGAAGSGGSIAVGGAGGTDAGGSGGSTGGGGSMGGGGSGGTVALSACDAATLTTAPSGACLADKDGHPLMATQPGVPQALATTVTVTAVGQADSGLCGRVTPMRTYALDGADGESRTLYLPAAVIPADLIQVGDSFEVEVSLSQNLFSRARSLFLRRNGASLLFDVDRGEIQFVPTPDLTSVGLTVADDGATCRTPPASAADCGSEGHRARISAGSESATLMTGETGSVGGFSVTVDSFYKGISGTNCDLPHRIALTGFAPRPSAAAP